MANGADYNRQQTIVKVERVKSRTGNGNPRWRVHFDDGTHALTIEDSGWSYEAENRDNHNVPMLVTYTSNGRIRHARRIEP